MAHGLRIGSILVCAGFTAAASAQSASGALSPREAHGEVEAGRILLVDIRTPAEWADTGVPRGALRLDAEASGFDIRLAGLRIENPGKRMTLIDRTGGLSASVQLKLAARGWRDLAIVRGGVLGQGGWLAEKLPTTP